jgi:nanoRNase/pAp phosphatase (c-di-AMP/oligoRNAs hydrolase)
VNEIIEEGRPIERFVENRNLEFVKKNSVCVHLCGYKFLAVNTYLDNSNALERVFQAKNWDAMMVFYRKSGGWSVSMYNGDHASAVNCEEIAQIYGGGGHRDAAGFFCKKLPFEV